MRLELKTGLRPIFSKKIGANYHSSSYCVFWGAHLFIMLKEHFLALQIVHPMTQKSLNLVQGVRKMF